MQQSCFRHGVSGSYSTPPPSELEVMGTIFLSIAEVFLHEISFAEKYRVREIQEIQSLPSVSKLFNSYIFLAPLRPPQEHPHVDGFCFIKKTKDIFA